MVNTDLVRKLRIRVKCDVYTCRDMAKFQVGHPIQPGTCFHFCADCMQKIFEETRDILATDFEEEQKRIKAEEEQKKLELQKAETKNIPLTPTVETNNVVVEEQKGKYVCKTCGKEFDKPDQLKEYRQHCIKCKKGN